MLQTDHGHWGEIYEVTFVCALDYHSERSWGWPQRASSTFDNRIRSKATIKIPKAYPASGNENIKVLHWGNPCLVGYNDHEVEVLEEKGVVNDDLAKALKTEIVLERKKSVEALQKAFGGARRSMASFALPRAARVPGKTFGKSLKGQVRPTRVLRVGRGNSILEEGLGEEMAKDKAFSAERQSLRREIEVPEYLREKVERLKEEFNIGEDTSGSSNSDPVRASMFGSGGGDSSVSSATSSSCITYYVVK
ncbi:hypothetical protein FOL47_004173 [Perkinsus chesapeaki]|uniref:Uncharacterized protein n=1 Tax=Perkinsus chesapeaki TaxID=330153 RepID=A0A7J6M5D9_PERCH|nr:hypothetical protein FOL47_004173 [Perkinsus chesapeaki]